MFFERNFKTLKCDMVGLRLCDDAKTIFIALQAFRQQKHLDKCLSFLTIK